MRPEIDEKVDEATESTAFIFGTNEYPVFTLNSFLRSVHSEIDFEQR